MSPRSPKKLDGATIATRANAQLEKQNPQLAPGALTCQKVRFKVGATSRCTRTVVLDDGRLVRSGATVTIDEVKDGGHFQVQVDDEPAEFGITGKAVFADLAKQYAARYKGKTPTGSCPPFLAGKVGTTITCSLDTAEGKLAVEVKVTRVDPKSFDTQYPFKSGQLTHVARLTEPSLSFVAGRRATRDDETCFLATDSPTPGSSRRWASTPASRTRSRSASKLNALRAAVLGANDGIVSVAGLVMGVAGATTDRQTILVAGMAGLVAGALSMAAGEYVSVSTQRDTERALIAKETRELGEEPEEELAELAELYRQKGLSEGLARQVAARADRE